MAPRAVLEQSTDIEPPLVVPWYIYVWHTCMVRDQNSTTLQEGFIGILQKLYYGNRNGLSPLFHKMSELTSQIPASVIADLHGRPRGGFSFDYYSRDAKLGQQMALGGARMPTAMKTG